MRYFCAATRFILILSVGFTISFTLDNTLLHNWETGHEKRDFARDTETWRRLGALEEHFNSALKKRERTGKECGCFFVCLKN